VSPGLGLQPTLPGYLFQQILIKFFPYSSIFVNVSGAGADFPIRGVSG
jgi:hypothetical protein